MDAPMTRADGDRAGADRRAADAGGMPSPDDRRLRQLADEQAALRRVATLVAGGASSDDVLAAVPEEAGRLLDVNQTAMIRYESDGTSIVLANWRRTGQAVPVIGSREPLGGRNLTTIIAETGRPARIDSYADATGAPGVAARRAGFRAAAGAPIVVQGRLWGAMIASSVEVRPLPTDTEARLTSFTEFVATAIANAHATQRLHELADTQAALRRLAMLVARGEPPEALFAAVTREALRRFGSGTARLIRFEPDGSATLMANEGDTDPGIRVGEPWVGYPRNGLTATVRRTGRAARVEDYAALEGGEATLREGIRSAVAVPIHVDGRLWGTLAVGPGPLPPDLELRMSEFTDLVATAVANAQNRAELVNSRARIVAASDDARRRIERDLHDGGQQRLLALALRLRSAAAPHHDDELGTELMHVATDILDVVDELRELSRGIHPAILSRAGLAPALRALARRSTIPVQLDVRIEDRLPEPIEVAAYYVASETLTNAAKHAHASVVEITAQATDTTLHLCVHDDGVGGADPGHGTGLVGLKDRVDALGGTLTVHSPAGSGTIACCQLPLPAR
ncbi:MAG: hypothetical protein QOE97_1806 [Pseudonocardiales bacterium]|nr:hypothetical protein [Pseudonocardiales bacterium]